MLIPLVDLPVSTAVDADKSAQLFDFVSHLGILGPVLIHASNSISSEAESAVFEELKTIVNTAGCYVEGLTIDDDELATQLLDQGTHLVYFTNGSERDLQKKVLKSFSRARVGVSDVSQIASVESMTAVIDEYREFSGHFLFRLPSLADNETILTILRYAKATVSQSFAIQISFVLPAGTSENEAAQIGTSHESIHVVFYPRIQTTFLDPAEIRSPYPNTLSWYEPQTATSQVELDYIGAYISGLRTDRPDGLFAAVVCDEHGVCLGLVYSNEQSIRTAISERRGVYWSRSRGGLWHKGESSGMYQELLGVKADCDGDALRFSVVQHGDPPAFCHLMTRTCWGPVHGIQKLEAILVDRKKSAPEGSYTKRLFDDPDLLQKKLLEEVQELVEATDPDHIAAEAADVMYFLMTRCVAAGVGIRDIERHLDKRTLKVTRRPGNAKAWRSENAAQILGGAGVDAKKKEETS